MQGVSFAVALGYMIVAGLLGSFTSAAIDLTGRVRLYVIVPLTNNTMTPHTTQVHI